MSATNKGNLHGFLTYKPEIGIASIGPEFLHDFRLLAKKFYYQYKLKVSFDDFEAKALEHALWSLSDHFDPMKGTISTFLFRVIWQQAYDTDKAMKRESFSGADDILAENPVEAQEPHESIPQELDLDFRKGLFMLAKDFHRKGVHLNQERIYLDFLSGDSNPIIDAILWRYVLNVESRVKNLDMADTLDYIAKELGLETAIVLGLYSIIDVDLFFVLDLLKGVKLQVPKSFSVVNAKDTLSSD